MEALPLTGQPAMYSAPGQRLVSNSVSLIGTDSPGWSIDAPLITRALHCIARQSAAAGAFNPGRTDRPSQYGSDISEPLGGIERLQEFAAQAARRQDFDYSHLLRMFGRPAYYIPVDFRQPILRIPRPGPLGRILTQRLFVGSSVRLLHELDSLGHELGLTNDAGEVGMQALEDATERGARAAETYSWSVLRWFARMSVEKSAIVSVG